MKLVKGLVALAGVAAQQNLNNDQNKDGVLTTGKHLPNGDTKMFGIPGNIVKSVNKPVPTDHDTLSTAVDTLSTTDSSLDDSKGENLVEVEGQLQDLDPNGVSELVEGSNRGLKNDYTDIAQTQPTSPPLNLQPIGFPRPTFSPFSIGLPPSNSLPTPGDVQAPQPTPRPTIDLIDLPPFGGGLPMPSNFPPRETPNPTKQPTPRPTFKPTNSPTPDPTPRPTQKPSAQPTPGPTPPPTKQPTPGPTSNPSDSPSDLPSKDPSGNPSDSPSVKISTPPSYVPSVFPSRVSFAPTLPTIAEEPSLVQNPTNFGGRDSVMPSEAPSIDPTSTQIGQPNSLGSGGGLRSSTPSETPSFLPTTKGKEISKGKVTNETSCPDKTDNQFDWKSFAAGNSSGIFFFLLIFYRRKIKEVVKEKVRVVVEKLREAEVIGLVNQSNDDIPTAVPFSGDQQGLGQGSQAPTINTTNAVAGNLGSINETEDDVTNPDGVERNSSSRKSKLKRDSDKNRRPQRQGSLVKREVHSSEGSRRKLAKAPGAFASSDHAPRGKGRRSSTSSSRRERGDSDKKQSSTRASKPGAHHKSGGSRSSKRGSTRNSEPRIPLSQARSSATVASSSRRGKSITANINSAGSINKLGESPKRKLKLAKGSHREEGEQKHNSRKSSHSPKRKS